MFQCHSHLASIDGYIDTSLLTASEQSEAQESVSEVGGLSRI